MTSKGFANFLLAAHLILLLVFLFGKWTHPQRGFGAWLTELRLNELGNTPARALNPRFVALSMSACNMIGILCLRSMHAQFYTWYQQTIPLILVFTEGLSVKFRVAIYILIEVCANRPPLAIASLGLLFGHISLLWFSFFKTT